MATQSEIIAEALELCRKMTRIWRSGAQFEAERTPDEYEYVADSTYLVMTNLVESLEHVADELHTLLGGTPGGSTVIPINFTDTGDAYGRTMANIDSIRRTLFDAKELIAAQSGMSAAALVDLQEAVLSRIARAKNFVDATFDGALLYAPRYGAGFSGDADSLQIFAQTASVSKFDFIAKTTTPNAVVSGHNQAFKAGDEFELYDSDGVLYAYRTVTSWTVDYVGAGYIRTDRVCSTEADDTLYGHYIVKVSN